MEDLLADVCGDKNYGDLIELNFSNKKISSVDPEIINQCVNLESLDISRNRLKSLMGLFLPKLKVLNFEDNSVSDVTFLSDLSSLEKLHSDGNPLNVADRYIAVDQLPNLKILDGKCCSHIQKILYNFEQQLIAEAKRIYSAKYEPLLKTAGGGDVIIQQRRLFTRELMNKTSLAGIPPKFQRYKVQTYVEQLFKNMVKPVSPGTPRKNSKSQVMNSPSCMLKKFNDLHLSSPNSAKKNLSVPSEPSVTGDLLNVEVITTSSALGYLENHLATPFLAQKKIKDKKLLKMKNERILRTRKKLNATNGDPAGDMKINERKRKQTFDESPTDEKRCLSYNPQIFLRCHVPTNDPEDCDTQVWGAAFEIDSSNESKTTNLVATCGGNIVCFINCETGHVIQRYKCDSTSENLFALDWTLLQSGAQEQKTSVLATGGTEMKIYLIHPSQLKCYHIFKAHTQPINCLRFHPTERSWLFSGGKDSHIHLWNIGEISLPNYCTKSKKLMTFEAQSEVIQIVFSQPYNCLFASMDKAIAVWNLNGGTANQKRKPSVVLMVPDKCKSEKSELVDGLSLVSDTCMAFKVSNSGQIVLWDFTSIFPGGKLTRKKLYEISPMAIYLWSDCDSDYSSINSCTNEKLLVCGDNAGRLWLYDVHRYAEKKCDSSASDIELPSVVLSWPNLLFENETLSVQEKVIVNSAQFNWNGDYLVACTDTNLVCIWKRG